MLLQYRQNKIYNEDNLCRHARHVIIFRFVTETDLLLTVTAADFMSHDVISVWLSKHEYTCHYTLFEVY